MGGSREPAIGHALGRLALMSAARAKTTVTVISLLTLVVGFGMVQLQTDSDLLKILPKDDPTTLAAHNASTEFRGFYDFVYVYYSIDEAKCAGLQDQLPNKFAGQARAPDDTRDCGDVRDETYVRAMDEFWQFVQQDIPFAEYSIDLSTIVKVVNYTNSGFANDDPQGSLAGILAGNADPQNPAPPRSEAFSMPGTDAVGAFQYEAAWQGANAADDSIDDVVSPQYTAGRTLLFFDTSQGLTRVELGRAVYDMVDHYQAAMEACDDGDAATTCSLRWNAFDADSGLAVRGVSALDAHASDVTKKDINRLAPFIIWAIVVILYAAFRDVRVLMVSAANLLIAFVWTAGLMGWLEIPFSALNMTIVPLILGVGIDYGIHMVSEFLEHKSDGSTNEEAFRQAGRRAGVAMLIATVTTASGLMLMVLSPSILMAQLGIVSALALTVTFAFTLTFIPALLSLTSSSQVRRRQHKGSEWFLRMARGIAAHRTITIVLLLVVSGAALAGARNLEPEPFGNPELNYPEGDRVRDDAGEISELFFGGDLDTQSNFLVVEGDLTDPKSHAFLDALEEGLRTDPDIQGISVTSLTRIVRAWKAIEQGTPDAIVNQFILANTNDPALADVEYPKTRAEIEQTFDDIFASPFANFMTVLLQPGTYDLGSVTYDTKQNLTFAEVERVWDATFRIIHETQREFYGVDQTDPAYDGPRAHPFGNNAFSFLFIEKQLPWVNYVAALAFGLVVVMIAALTRNLRATACTAVIMTLTSLWWLGLLPLMGVGLSVGLMLPLVFIMAIGSDDAIHLIWNMEQTHDRERVYRFVGKAVTLTTVTTLAAFIIFSFQTDLLVRRTLLATAGAVTVMWLSTVAVVPLFYPPPAMAEPVARPERPHPASRSARAARRTVPPAQEPPSETELPLVRA